MHANTVTLTLTESPIRTCKHPHIRTQMHTNTLTLTLTDSPIRTYKHPHTYTAGKTVTLTLTDSPIHTYKRTQQAIEETLKDIKVISVSCASSV